MRALGVCSNARGGEKTMGNLQVYGGRVPYQQGRQDAQKGHLCGLVAVDQGSREKKDT